MGPLHLHSITTTGNLYAPSTSGTVASSLTFDISAGSAASSDDERASSLEGFTPSRPTQLYGRKEQCAQIKDAYDRISQPAATSEVVLVHGESGTGKSTAVETLRRHVTRNDFGYFVCGKFDQLRGNEPHSAIVAAFTDLIDLIQQGGNLENIREAIREELQGDAAMFAQLVTNLAVLDPSLNVDYEQCMEMVGQALVRFKLACRSFLRAVASAEHPLVIFIDDLQFAGDEASLEVIEAIMTDPASKNVLVVAAYRDDQQDRSRLERAINIVSNSKREDAVLRITDIHVVNLDTKDANHLLSDLLDLDKISTLPLASLIVRKTHGNVYYILKYLEFLQTEELLTPSDDEGKWKWDLRRIEVETDVSDNVADLLANKIQRLSEEMQSTLKYAACIGNRFEFILLAKLVKHQCFMHSGNLKNLPISEDSSLSSFDSVIEIRLREVLKQAVKECLVEEYCKGSYKWEHERIQQCIYANIEAPRKNHIHLTIGKLLVDVAETTVRNDALVFLSVDQFNLGSSCIHDPVELIDLAGRCFHAGKLSVTKSAYTSASKYLRHGLVYLKQSGTWIENYDFALDLHSMAAEVEYCCGHFNESEIIGREVFDHARCLDDKLRVYFTLMKSLGSRARFSEAMQVGYSVLALLGAKVPARTTMVGIIRAKRAVERQLKGMSDSDILNLPRMNDTKKVTTMKLLNSMAYYCYWQMDRFSFTKIIFKMIMLSLEWGLDGFSAPAFANYGLLSQIFGKGDIAYRFSMLSIKILQKLTAKKVEAATLAIVYSFVMHWRRPLYEGVCPFERCVDNGLRIGDSDFAFMGSAGLLMTYFNASCIPLDELQLQYRIHCTRMQEYGHHHYLHMLPSYQLLLCLVGEAEEPSKLSGSAFDGDERYADLKKSKDVLAFRILAMAKLQLAFFFGDWEALVRLLPDMKRTYNKAQVHLMSFITILFTALSHYVVYEKTKKHAHLKAGRKLRDTIQSWVDKGNANCEPALALLKAEEACLSEDTKTIEEAFNEAQEIAGREGFIYFEAISAERAGLFFEKRGDRERANRNFRQSATLFERWGAIAKVDDIVQKHLPSCR